MTTPYRPRVLIVEDDPGAAAMLTALLGRSGDCDVIRVDTLAAVDEAALGSLDAVVLDLLLSDAGVPQTSATARRWQRVVPVVVLSGQIGDLPAARELGDHVYAVLEKPSTPQTILGTVRGAARSRAAHRILGRVAELLGAYLAGEGDQ